MDIFVSGEVHFKGTMYFKGSVLQLHIGVLQIGYLWSYSSLSGLELTIQKAVGVVLGFTCSKCTPGAFSYTVVFPQLKPLSHWEFD